MADAVVEPRRTVYRFFCHRCNVEFEDVIQDYTCPFCATGFIEQLENDRDNQDDGEYSDAEMSNIDDAGHNDDDFGLLDDSQGPPVLNDLAFLMSGGNVRSGGIRQEGGGSSGGGGGGGGGGGAGTVMDHFLWMIGGGRAHTGAVTAGAPFVLVGAPGDYVFGGEGLDAVVTQLLGQLENTGPAPLARDLIDAIPFTQVSADQVAANLACSVCWDNFTFGETVSRLECEHIFHPTCIKPWLQLHATCPICRRSLQPPGAAPATAAPTAPAAPAPAAPAPAAPAPDSARSVDSATTTATTAQNNTNTTTTPSTSSSATDTTASTPSSYSRVVVRVRDGLRRRRLFPSQTQTPGQANSQRPNSSIVWESDTSSSHSGLPGGLWAQLATSLANVANAVTQPQESTSASSLNSDRDRQYMDIDFD